MAGRSPIERKCYRKFQENHSFGARGCPKTARRRPQDGTRTAPRTAPRWPKMAPRRPKVGPGSRKMARDRRRWAKGRIKMGEEYHILYIPIISNTQSRFEVEALEQEPLQPFQKLFQKTKGFEKHAKPIGFHICQCINLD